MQLGSPGQLEMMQILVTVALHTVHGDQQILLNGISIQLLCCGDTWV